MAEVVKSSGTGQAAIHLVACDHIPELGAEIAAAMGDSEMLAFEDAGATPEQREFNWSLLNDLLVPQIIAEMTEAEAVETEMWLGIFSYAGAAVWQRRGSGQQAELVDILTNEPEFPIIEHAIRIGEQQDGALSLVQPVSELLVLKEAQTVADLASNNVREARVTDEAAGLATWYEGYTPRRVSLAHGAGHAAMLQSALVGRGFEVTTAAVGPSTTYTSYDAQLRDKLRAAPGEPLGAALTHRAVLSDMCYAAYTADNPLTPLQQSYLRKNIHAAIEQLDDEAVFAACDRWDAVSASGDSLYAKQTQVRGLVSFEPPPEPAI